MLPSPVVQNLELRVIENFLGQLELVFEGREKGIAFNDALHEGQV